MKKNLLAFVLWAAIGIPNITAQTIDPAAKALLVEAHEKLTSGGNYHIYASFHIKTRGLALSPIYQSLHVKGNQYSFVSIEEEIIGDGTKEVIITPDSRSAAAIDATNINVIEPQHLLRMYYIHQNFSIRILREEDNEKVILITPVEENNPAYIKVYINTTTKDVRKVVMPSNSGGEWIYTIHNIATSFEEGSAILQRLDKQTKSYTGYRVHFTLDIDSRQKFKKASGILTVSGEKFSLKMPGKEIFCDGKSMMCKEGRKIIILDKQEWNTNYIDASQLFTMAFSSEFDIWSHLKDNNLDVIELRPFDRLSKIYSTLTLFIDNSSNQIVRAYVNMDNGDKYMYHVTKFEPNVIYKF